MTILEIAQLTGKGRTTIDRWAGEASLKMGEISLKMGEARRTSKPANFTLEETLLIVRQGNPLLADLLLQNANLQKQNAGPPLPPNDRDLANMLRAVADRLTALSDRVKELEAGQRLLSAPPSSRYTVSDAAKALSSIGVTIGQRELFDFMRDNRMIFRSSDRWAPYQSYVNSGLFQYRKTEKNGIEHMQIFVTEKGLRELASKLAAKRVSQLEIEYKEQSK